MKVALTASFWNVDPVREILEECEVIYTTNVRMRDRLWEALGAHRVHFIPNASPAMMKFLKDQHEGCEFVEYGQLHKIYTDLLAAGDAKTIYKTRLHLGWKIEKVSLYDEEGIEGERWTKGGMEFTAMEGEVPEGVINIYKKAKPQ